MGGIAARVAAWSAGYRNLPAPTPATVATVPPVTFPATLLDAKVFIALGADLSKPWYTWSWTDITQWVRFADGITTGQGRPDESGTVRTSSAALRLDNRDGRFSRRNPTGPYYGLLTFNTPIWGTIDPGSGTVTRLQQYVNEWPVRWDRSGKDSTAPIACAGILRRLAQGSDPRSAMRRSIAAAKPTAYWSLEDGSAATQAGSGIPGATSLSTTGPVKFGATTKPAGSDSAVDLPPTSKLSGPTGIAGGVATAWELELALAFGILPTGNPVGNRYTVVTVDTPGSVLSQWGVVLLDGATTPGIYDLGVWWYDPVWGGTRANWGPAAVAAGRTYHWRMRIRQVGPDIFGDLYLDGVLTKSANLAPGTLYAPTRLALNESAGTADPSANPTQVSHVAIWMPPRTAATTYRATTGYAGEMAHARIARLCAEEGVPFLTTAAISAPMGAQAAGTFLASVRDAEAVDTGVLYETAWGLGYQALSERCNAPVGLPLDFHAGHIAVEPEPADDDQRLRNRWRVSRPGGSDDTAEQATGPLGTGIGGPGVYDDSVTVNVQTDSQLASQAGWRRHMGTVDEDRWPNIALRLHGTPSLIGTWTALPYGARVQAVNPPPQVAPDAIDAIIEGWAERWDPLSWDVTLYTSPYRPYEVQVVGASGNRGRVDMVNSTLAVDATSAATTIYVASTGALWRTGAVNFDLELGGERMTVTNIGSYLNANSYFEADASGWTASNSTIAQSTAFAHEGVASLLITPDGVNASGGANASARVPVTPLVVHTASLWVYSPGGWTDLRPAVDWYTAVSGGSFISTSLGSAFVVPAGVWTLLSVSYTAPAAAGGAVMRARHGGTPTAANIWYADEITLTDPTRQLFTVTRSVNTVVKAQTATTKVRLWKPGVYGLRGSRG